MVKYCPPEPKQNQINWHRNGAAKVIKNFKWTL